MLENPLVSVITPSYNQGRFLEETIRSVLAQDYPNIEYLVMDGGSTDGSVEVIQRYADRLAYWESCSDRGQAHAINKGLLRARGEILGWLNSDDLLLPSTMRIAIDTFTRHPEVDVVYGRLERIDAEGREVLTPLLPKDLITFGKDYVIGECVVNQPGSFWRRRVMEKTGTLDERLVYNLDYEWWIRLALGGARFMRIPQVVARFRLSESSKTVSQAAAMAEEQLGLLDTLLARPDLPEILGFSEVQLQRRARRARADISLHAFYGYFKAGQWNDARHWLFHALSNDPTVLFQRRWFKLMGTSLARRLRSEIE